MPTPTFLRTLLLAFGTALPLAAWAQLPPNQPEQDCFAALPVCQDIFVQTESYTGEGENPDEISGAHSCFLIGEQNSVWYVFTVQTSGSLCFTIMPVDTLDDYDWALFDLTGRSCADIETDPNLEVACNFTYNMGCQGHTGANGRTDCPDQNEPCLQVQAGRTYVLNVSNFTASNSGYTLDFSASSAQLYDNIPPEVTALERHCQGATVTFSENVLCATVDPGDFTFSGPGGPYTVAAIQSQNCGAGGEFDNTFDLIVSPPYAQGGTYTVALVGSITDNCGNPAVLSTGQVQLPPPPQASINTHAPQCEEGNQFGFGYPGPTAVTAYRWDFGDGNGSSLAAPIHRYQDFGPRQVQLVIRDLFGCYDTATTPVDVLPGPRAQFSAPAAVCQRDTFTLLNEVTPQGGAAVTQYSWYLADGSRYDNVWSPQHQFDQPGTYRVLLEAFNSLGCRDTLSRMITVWPLAAVDFLPEAEVCIGDSAQLINLSGIPAGFPNDSIVDWWWDFGDSTGAGALMAPVHLYDTAGAWPVTLTVVTDKGCRDSLTLDQIIHQPPPPVVVDTPVCWGKRAFLQGLPEPGGLTHWYTHPADTTPILVRAVLHTEPVVYPDTFYAEVISEMGCVSPRVPVYARHHPLTEGTLSLPDTALRFPDPLLSPEVLTSLDLRRYAWDFGDGQTDSVAQPTHRYAYPNRYEVRLLATDVHGCPHRWSSTVVVRQHAFVAVPSAFSPNGDGINDELYVAAGDLAQFRLAVYRRDGREVFAATQLDFRWNGVSAQGHPLPPGVYVYRVSGVDHTGNPLDQTGTITLLR